MNETDLKDRNGKVICIGDTVQWDDSEGKRTAKVVGSREHIGFKCFKNEPDNSNWAVGNTFCLDNFIYANTSKHLTVISNKE